MSRKKAKNRNLKIGIFEGKEAQYNQAILEVLFHKNNSLTSWQIAKLMQAKLKETNNKEIRQSRTRNIYSVIQRKGGRLYDLEDKGYIHQIDGRWRLNLWKGYIAVLIKNPEIIRKLDEKECGYNLESLKDRLEVPPDIEAPFGISINGKKMKADVERLLEALCMLEPKFAFFLVGEVEGLLRSGIDLDAINNHALVVLLSQKRSVKKRLHSFIKKKHCIKPQTIGNV